MSVPSYKRRLSPVQYIAKAQELLRITVKNCEKFPKRYTFFGVQKAYEYAQNIVDNCIRANMTSLQTEPERRMNYLNGALRELACLSNHLQFLKVYDGLEDKRWVAWGLTLDECERLIKGVISSDKKRN